MNIIFYAVIDYYEEKELIGFFNTEEEAEKARQERIDDTDGECDVYIKRMELR